MALRSDNVISGTDAKTDSLVHTDYRLINYWPNFENF